MVTFSAIRHAAVMFLRGCRVLPFYCGVLTHDAANQRVNFPYQFGPDGAPSVMHWDDAWFWTKEEAAKWCYEEACDHPHMTTGHVCKATMRVAIKGDRAEMDVDTVYEWTLPSAEWRTITA